jgi:FkbM family methyltransferase
MIKHSASTVRKAVFHLRRGTLVDRLRSEFATYRERKIEWKNWRRHWESQVGKDKRVEVEIQPGVNMHLYSDSRISLDIYQGKFELQEQKFLNTFLKEGDIFIDIGANLGLFTLIAARCVGNKGSVYAFEPCSRTFKRLLENVELNHFANVSCYQLALSDHAGQREMTILSNGFDAWNSLTHTSRNPFATQRVDCITWDDFSKQHGLLGSVTMLKIDVEGWEKNVILGGAEALSRKDAPLLQVEFSDATSRAAKITCKELYQTLLELGYQVFKYDAILKKIISHPLQETYDYTNLIATKNPSEVAARLNGKYKV